MVDNAIVRFPRGIITHASQVWLVLWGRSDHLIEPNAGSAHSDGRRRWAFYFALRSVQHYNILPFVAVHTVSELQIHRADIIHLSQCPEQDESLLTRFLQTLVVSI